MPLPVYSLGIQLIDYITLGNIVGYITSFSSNITGCAVFSSSNRAKHTTSFSSKVYTILSKALKPKSVQK
jgi:hypothetical protein